MNQENSPELQKLAAKLQELEEVVRNAMKPKSFYQRLISKLRFKNKR